MIQTEQAQTYCVTATPLGLIHSWQMRQEICIHMLGDKDILSEEERTGLEIYREKNMCSCAIRMQNKVVT
jgi:hypothetical protein